MGVVAKSTLKGYFETGDTPTEAQFSDTIDNAYNGTVSVGAKSDLPSSVSGVITLEDSTIYEIIGTIDLGSDRLVMGANTTIRGKAPNISILTSTTTGALISSTRNFRLWEVGLTAASGSIFDLNGSGVEVCLCVGIRISGGGTLGSVDSFDLFEINIGLVAGFTGGLTFTGSNAYAIFQDVTFFETSNTGSTIDFGTATFNSIKIVGSDFTVSSGEVGITVAANGANINSGGAGIIVGTSFQGSGTSISGYTGLEDEWTVYANDGIDSSDRLESTGWGFYSDGETSPATQTFNTSASKVQIDGGGATTETTYLPLYLRSTDGDLWDGVNNKVTPISVGDSYVMRLALTLTGKSGNPDNITMQFDIGGGASPSVVIARRSHTLSGNYPEYVNVSFNIFSLTTFLNNGMQIFVSTDSGSVTCSERNILIQRTSSGAI